MCQKQSFHFVSPLGEKTEMKDMGILKFHYHLCFVYPLSPAAILLGSHPWILVVLITMKNAA
jgi:hypothetical protein